MPVWWIDPHFMFNNFSILSELIVENRTLAERFLENLSSVYRYVIQNLKRDTVPVSEELDFLRSYLYLIGMRYENAISVDVDEQLERTDGRIPRLPPAAGRNAIKHNRLSVHQPLHIHVFREGNHIVVKTTFAPCRPTCHLPVSDNGTSSSVTSCCARKSLSSRKANIHI